MFSGVPIFLVICFEMFDLASLVGLSAHQRFIFGEFKIIHMRNLNGHNLSVILSLQFWINNPCEPTPHISVAKSGTRLIMY